MVVVGSGDEASTILPTPTPPHVSQQCILLADFVMKLLWAFAASEKLFQLSAIKAAISLFPAAILYQFIFDYLIAQ